MISNVTPRSAIDWDGPGRRVYHVPFTDDNTWSRTRVPVAIYVGAKPGKTIVAIGGTHGDEYEGPIGLKNLIADLRSEDVLCGRLIVIPVLNVAAFRAGQRGSPVDGKNMNRVFPGSVDGSITERIAEFLTTEVLERADIVLDIHSGGRDYEIARCVSFHEVADPTEFARFRDNALLFGMPFVLVYTSGMGTKLLTEQAERMDKITLGGEFGFGASADLDGVRWAHHGVRNIMRHHGLLAGPIEELSPPGLDRQRVVSATDIDRWLTAPVSGIIEPLAPLGGFVQAGTPVCRMHDFERFDEPGIEILADQDGYVMCRRFRAPTTQGDVVVVIGQELGETRHPSSP